MKPKTFFFALLSTALLVTIVTAGVFVLIQGSLKTKSREIARAKADIQLTQEAMDNRQLLESQLKKLGDDREVLNGFVPDQKDQKAAIKELVSIVEAANIKVSPISFTPTEALPGDTSQVEKSRLSPRASSLPMTINGSGSYNNLYGLLRRFESSHRHMNVNEVNISSSADTLSFSIKLEVAFFKADKKGGSK